MNTYNLLAHLDSILALYSQSQKGKIPIIHKIQYFLQVVTKESSNTGKPKTNSFRNQQFQ